MQKEQLSSFEKLEAVVDEAQHVHVEMQTEHTRIREVIIHTIYAGMSQHIQCMFGMQDFMMSGIH